MIEAYYLPPESKDIRHVTEVEETIELYRRGEGLLWVDMEKPTDEEAALLSDGFDLHPVVVETCAEVTGQPRIHDYETYLFFVLHAVDFNRREADVATLEVDIVWSKHVVLTYHRDRVRTLTEMRERMRDGGPALLSRGADFFLHAIVDRIIDNFSPTVQRLDEMLETIEEQMFAEPTDELLQQVIQAKRTAARLGRIAAALAYWRDAYDHLMRMVQTTETQRDLIASLRDTYLALASNRMNEVMKVLTIIATIFIPITFIAGVYGMNFEWMPELEVKWAYPATLAAMALVAGAMLLYFRRKDWL